MTTFFGYFKLSNYSVLRYVMKQAPQTFSVIPVGDKTTGVPRRTGLILIPL